MTTSACRSCDAPFEGAYCPGCGQPRPRPDDFSLRRLLAEAWTEVSDTDSRLWRSVQGLVIPGRLTRAWLDHDWSRHLPPLRLYLIASGEYFLLAWDVGFQVSADALRNAPPGAVPPEMMALHNDPAASGQVSDLTALFKFLFVILMGFWLALLHWGNRRPAGEHRLAAELERLVRSAGTGCHGLSPYSLVATLRPGRAGSKRLHAYSSLRSIQPTEASLTPHQLRPSTQLRFVRPSYPLPQGER